MKKRLALLLLLCGLPATRAADVSADLRAILGKHPDVPGIVAARIDGDDLTVTGVAGVRKAGEPAPLKFDDDIHLGSDTKAMTAVVVERLIERKKIKPDTTVAELFADEAKTADSSMATATVEQLLRHTAGLPHDLPWGRFRGDLRGQRRAVVKAALALKPEHPPGSTYEYSNVGYVILGAIVERLTDKPWEDAIGEELFAPLKMTTAGFGPPEGAWGHLVRDGHLIPSQSDNPPVMGPAGRVHCTITDWAKFVARFEDGRPLTPIRKQAGDYVDGWLRADRKWADGPALTHAGSNTMWYCVAWVAPDKHMATLAAVNVGGDDGAKACDEATGVLIRSR